MELSRYIGSRRCYDLNNVFFSVGIWVKHGLFVSIAGDYGTINYCWKRSYGHVLILTNLYAYISIDQISD